MKQLLCIQSCGIGCFWSQQNTCQTLLHFDVRKSMEDHFKSLVYMMNIEIHDEYNETY